MKKTCVICGSTFYAPASDKKVTCSPLCRSKRAAISAKNGHKWSKSAKDRRAKDASVVKQMREMQQIGVAAALSIPEGQRGPQNRSSKVWELIDPDGNHIHVTNLLDWARKHYTYFEPDCPDPDAAALRISYGFRAIAGSMRGCRSRKHPIRSYKGWGLARLPECKQAGDAASDAHGTRKKDG